MQLRKRAGRSGPFTCVHVLDLFQDPHVNHVFELEGCSPPERRPQEPQGNMSMVQPEAEPSEGGFDLAPTSGESWEGVTTTMIRRMPRAYTRDDLWAELESVGLSELCDFLYLPWDRRKGANVGYGFVNFETTAAAKAFRDAFDGQAPTQLPTLEAFRIHPAAIQGYEENLRHLEETWGSSGSLQTNPGTGPLFKPKTSSVLSQSQQALVKGGGGKLRMLEYTIASKPGQGGASWLAGVDSSVGPLTLLVPDRTGHFFFHYRLRKS